jgi:hypothetical protein
MTKETSILSLWNTRLLSLKEFNKLECIDQLKYLGIFGSLAPTTHNTVPERYKIYPDLKSIQLFIDSDYILPASDKVGRQAIISMGCVLENIICAAECYGLKSNISFSKINIKDLAPSKKQKKFRQLATLNFTNSRENKLNIEHLELMLNRKVLRAEYDPGKKIPSSLISNLKNYSQQYSDLDLKLINNKFALNAISKIQEIADRAVIERDEFAYELGNWLIPNENQSAPIGMRGYEFGFDNDFSKRIHSGLLRKIRLLPDETAAFGSGGKIGIRSSPLLGVITTNKECVSSWINAGRLYESIALRLTKDHFYTAMHAGITEVKIVSRMMAALLKIGGTPLVIFRIGKPQILDDANRRHSSKPCIEDLII